MKAILVIDKMPESCANCRLKRGLFCGENGNSLHDYVYIDVKPSWCPLKPLPELMSWGHTLDYIYGYNDCLKEITGETK